MPSGEIASRGRSVHSELGSEYDSQHTVSEAEEEPTSDQSSSYEYFEKRLTSLTFETIPDLPDLGVDDPNEVLTLPPFTPTQPISPTQTSTKTMDSPLAPCQLFYGLKDGREDALEFLEDLDFKITEKSYTTADRTDVALRVTFRNSLRSDAYTWYQNQPKDTKATWTSLRTAFLKEYVLDIPIVPEAKPFEYFDLMYNLRQGNKDIVSYIEEAERIHRECPSNLQEYLGR